jgi:hypothetical protein
MPKSTEQVWDAQQRRYVGTRETGTDENVTSKARLQSASGLGSVVKSDAFVPPKMEPNEDSAKYSARVARAREAHNQRRAMRP